MNPAMEVPLALLCGTFPEGDPVEGEPAPSARLALRPRFDWREQVPLPVRSQGVCRGCWAFAPPGARDPGVPA